ncbi:MAG: NADP-dependent oxidoreductase [Acidobacteriaceae bacterium]|nr:NADP-dependent oxidoreductase [Acidobacteriaceae bacterium]
MATQNRVFRLAARPVGLPKRSDWKLSEETLSDPAPGELLIKVLYISLDPAMRGWMNEMKTYVDPVKIGDVMRAIALGRVIASQDARFKEGDFVTGMFGIQEYAPVKGDHATKVDPSLASLPVYLSALGGTGMTAYFGLLEVGNPKPGETVVVSAAAGAVGSIAGQIAKIKGCRAVGIAGGPEKCRYIVDELGFDAAVDYKSEDVSQALAQRCPGGIDVYFDNVGGDILDIVLTKIRLHARIVICGAISQYNNTTPIKGPSNYLSLLINRSRMEGMLVFDFRDRYPEAIREMAGWIAQRKLKSREDIVSGLDTFPETFLKLFKGENVGKLILKVADP